MRSYFRKSVDVGDNTRYIVRYTPSEYLLISVIKLIFFIFVVWPVQILWLIFTFPFRLIGKFYKSSLPINNSSPNPLCFWSRQIIV